MEVYLGNPGEKLTAWCKANYGKPLPANPFQGGKFTFTIANGRKQELINHGYSFSSDTTNLKYSPNTENEVFYNGKLGSTAEGNFADISIIITKVNDDMYQIMFSISDTGGNPDLYWETQVDGKSIDDIKHINESRIGEAIWSPE